MVSPLLRAAEPRLLRMYRALADPPAPNLRGDRDIEYSWILTNMPEGPGECLEFGCGSGYLGLAAARRGFRTLAIDLTPVRWFYRHPNLAFAQRDLFDMSLHPCSMDLIINCSAVEHVGLGRYGDLVGQDEDLRAMALLRNTLKPGGTMLLTIPVGGDRTFQPLHRIYGPKRLPRLLEHLQVRKEEFWLKDDNNCWVLTSREQALDYVPHKSCYALGCFALVA